jgi:hypothetical protein
MRYRTILIYLLIFLLLSVILSYYFLYNVYGTEVRLEPASLYADPTSEVTLKVIPINALGYQAIFRNSNASFEIVDGKELVEIIFIDKSAGLLKLKSVGRIGIVGIKINTPYSLMQEYFEIEIKSLLAYTK